MISRRNVLANFRFVSAFLLLLVSLCSGLNAQTRQFLTWRDNLAAIRGIQAADLERQRDVVAQIRAGVDFWLRMHPGTKINLAEAPAQPWNSDQIAQQVSLLGEAVDAIIKEDPGKAFELGVTVVSVTAEASLLSPVTDSIDNQIISDLHLTNVAQSIQYVPGLTIDHKSNRNQAGVQIRGFDTRQVGIYLDGVPILVPYDGYADIARFQANDIAEIEVAKGYSSPLLGPNGLGGAINIVTRAPEKRVEGDASIGTGSGRLLESGFHLGSHMKNFFFRGGMDWLQTDYFPLPGDFQTSLIQPGYNRVNSYTRDVRYSGRAGWTPRGDDQYVFTYTNQKADYGVPPYSGNDTKSNKTNFWQWPTWNRESYYLNTNTGLGESNSIKFRLFYDHYPNRMDSFTDYSYSVYSGTISPYDDFSAGTSAEFASRTIKRHALGASFFFKDDTHREQGNTYSSKGVLTTVQPVRTDRDQQISIGFQDAVSISAKLRATFGFSADHLNAIKAQDINTKTNTLTTFTCQDGTAAPTFSACLAQVWDFNPLASVSYSLGNSGTVFFTFARKSHFPTLKDRYSYKNGQAVPNVGLQPEHANNFSLGYSHAFPLKTMMQLDLFRSDVSDAIENAYVPARFSKQCPSQKDPMLCQQSINVGKEVHQGVEFTLRSAPVSRLALDANYSYLSRTISGPSTMPVVFPTGTPKHRVLGTASIQMPRKIMLLATARYESGTITTNNLNVVVPASKFGTMDFGGTIPIFAGATLQAGVKNLFDRFYYYQEGFPEAGRNWYANLRYRF